MSPLPPPQNVELNRYVCFKINFITYVEIFKIYLEVQIKHFMQLYSYPKQRTMYQIGLLTKKD